MLERELKLHVPAAVRAEVAEKMRTLGAHEQRLRAQYYDTRYRDLASAGITLRLRLEGENWVQTAKAPGPDELSRVELNHPRPDATLDLSVYEGTVIAPVLARMRRPLRIRYETDIVRLTARHDAGAGATVEICYDLGTVQAGALALEICELEFELVQGPPAAIFETAKKWHQRHGLILDLRSKGERGDLLAQHAMNDGLFGGRNRNRRGRAGATSKNARAEAAETSTRDSASASARASGRDSARASAAASTRTSTRVPAEVLASASGAMEGLRIDPTAQALLKPALSESVVLTPDMSPQQAYVACVASCLETIIRNATLLAGVDNAGSGEALQRRYVHQLRVGLRRLRTCWKFFAKWVEPPPQARRLARFFQHLGVASDYHVLRYEIAPKLAEAGMPPLPLPVARTASPDGPDARELAASRPFQSCLLALLAHQIDVAEAPAAHAGKHARRHFYTDGRGAAPVRDLGAVLAQRLQKWLRSFCQEGRTFRKLPKEAQHDLRKKLKRLRYSIEFSESVLPPAQLDHIRKLLEPIQHNMGDLNDLYNAQTYYEAAARKQPAALFALGWLKASQDHLARQVQAALDRLETEARSAG